jgi:hypothetical protein
VLSVKQLRAIQAIGQKMFIVYADIYNKLPFAFDDSNPYGDDTVVYSDTPIRVKGWLHHINAANDMMINVGQVVSVEHAELRVPVGTNVKPADKVVIAGDEFKCTEALSEQSWPEWLVLRLTRIHH